jgi:hypothetical protein
MSQVGPVPLEAGQRKPGKQYNTFDISSGIDIV